MAALNQIRIAMRTMPFWPFTVKLAGGRSFFVLHPELISMDRSPRPGACDPRVTAAPFRRIMNGRAYC